MPRRLRWGMVGGGRGAFIGQVHRMAARLDDGYELVAGALSSDPERAKLSAGDCHIAPERSYADYRMMAGAEPARSDGIDVVSIVTPNASHAAIARAFLEAGIDVICDKPLATNYADAKALQQLAGNSGRLLGVTYNYTGYPMVREMRALIANGVIGNVRLVQAEFALGWLAVPLEKEASKQAEWRTDPALQGPSGIVADVGTHTLHLAEFASGLTLREVSSDLKAFVPGRQLEDDANILLHFDNGARGHLWASMVAAGETVGLRVRIYGETGHFAWDQALPDHLHFRPLKGAPQTILRGAGSSPGAKEATRLVPSLPEGFIEAFANLYRNYAEIIHARHEGRQPSEIALLAPRAEDGVRGLAFVEAVLASNARGGSWITLN